MLPDPTEINGPPTFVATPTPSQPQAPPEAAPVAAEPATPGPKRTKQNKRKPTKVPPVYSLVATEPALPIPTAPSTMPTPPVVSAQNFEAIDENGRACYVTYMYGVNHAMVMTVELKPGQ